MCVLFWAAVVAVLVAIFAVLLPKALARPIQALINLLMRKLTRGQLIALCLGAVAFLPCTLFIPMQPFIWVAGIAFDFPTAFGIVMVGSFIGMSIQYWAAHYLFKSKVEKHLLKRRKDGISVALRAVDIAGPWKVVALVRLGPSPYAAMNYIFGVCPQIRYHQYIIASTICVSHHRALSVFFGRSMPSLAQLFSGQPVTNVSVAVYRFVVLALGIALCIVIVILAKKALKKITEQELEREEREAAAAAAAAAAEAAEDGTAGAAPDTRKSVDAGFDAQKRPLPLAVESKLGEAGAGSYAPLDHKSTGSGSEGDLQVIVVDSAPAPTPAVLADDPSFVRQGSLIPAGQLPPAAMETDASTSSRMSSVSSLRGLLGSRFQRSS
jgi:uncharacterized membrane protein YdjX (TVP38/TMEM64 family)